MHSDHCLSMLLQGVKCHGDTTPLTYRWGHAQAIPLANLTSPHECVNFDNIVNWAKERSVDVFQPGLVVHPTLGECCD